MSKLAISIEGLSKKYKLGSIGTGTLSRDLNKWWANFMGKTDPYASIDSDVFKKINKDDFWALKNINLDVEQGEILGIIGKNGAGKSTLLKIISRITAPTLGEIKICGRISSLLEIGTGFHPDLTGRDNIYLNGAILGMTRREIKTKLDEIISFSGVEQHIDTPVKRYSSGMHVRLAFAVAAHLEPEILIVDEVLAVGDADFQQKCLGKMKEVSRTEGRTILFVSHNIQAIQNLCNKAVWLHEGHLKLKGNLSNVVNSYITNTKSYNMKQTWENPTVAPNNRWVRLNKLEVKPDYLSANNSLDIRTPINIEVDLYSLQKDINLSIELRLYTYSGECVFVVASPVIKSEVGMVNCNCYIPGNFLNFGSYYITLFVVKDTTTTLFIYEECLSFDLEDYRGDIKWFGEWPGIIRPKLPFTINQLSSKQRNITY